MAEKKGSTACDGRPGKANSKSLPAQNSAATSQSQPIKFEIKKNAREKYCIAVDPNGVAELVLHVADGRGNYKPTREKFGFHVKHTAKIRALFDKIGGAE